MADTLMDEVDTLQRALRARNEAYLILEIEHAIEIKRGMRLESTLVKMCEEAHSFFTYERTTGPILNEFGFSLEGGVLVDQDRETRGEG